ncbi:MAG: TIR domain-containing protein [Desulfobacterales bacterium]|nr:TIR domain-containing protein [Desulfobacterales bacterium]
MSHYLPSTPARGELFYNRETQLETIMNAGWVWVCGQRRVGKTSLLYQAETEAEKRKQIPLFLDLMSLEEFSGKGLFDIFMIDYSRLLKQYHIKINDLPLENPAECFYQVISALANQKICVMFLWDEAEMLIKVEKNDPGILKKLRARLSRIPDFRFIISATQLLTALYDQESDLVSSFLQTFHWMPLPALEIEDAKKLLRCDQISGWLNPLPEPIINKAVNWSGGHPLILQTLGAQLSEKTNQDGKNADSQILQNCFKHLSDNVNLRRIIEDDFVKLTQDQQNLLKRVIKANGKISIKDIEQEENKPPEYIHDALRFLSNYSYIYWDDDMIRLRFNFYPDFLPLSTRPSAADPKKVDQIRRTIFISYSHKDADYLNELKTHLDPLISKQEIEAWDDQKIQPGDQWLEEIKKALRRARVAVLLISPDFLNSEFITRNEVPELLSKANNKGCRILCLYIRPSVVDNVTYEANGEIKLTGFQGLNSPDQPLSKLSEPDRDQLMADSAINICQQTILITT